LTGGLPWSGTLTSDTAWHRYDYTIGWSSAAGAYTPAGALGTLYSARFHTYDAPAGTFGDFITPNIDFSAQTGTKRLSFYYINPTGTTIPGDSLSIYMSTDGGSTWGSRLFALRTATLWTQFFVNLGTTTSSTVKIKFLAGSDYGADDIGLDEVSISTVTPLTGNKFIDNTGSGDYLSFTQAITALNTLGVGTAGVTFNVVAGQTFTENPPAIVACGGGTVSGSIVFQKSGIGANPLLRPSAAGTIATTVLGSGGDAVIRIAGTDYLIFDGIDVNDYAAATDSVTRYEYGYYLVKNSASDACQNVTIRNCGVTLNKLTPMSSGIYVSNNDSFGTAMVVNGLEGRHADIKIYGNTISNVNLGIQLRGYAALTPYTFYDQNIEVGVTAGNTLSNYGGEGATYYSYGIYAIYQNNVKINNNIITGGNNTVYYLYGIYTTTGTNSNVDIIGNDVSLTSAGLTNTVYGIYNGMGATGTTNTINIKKNVVHDFTWPTVTTGVLYCLYHSASGAVLVNVDSNTVRNIAQGGTGNLYGIYTYYGNTRNVRFNKVYNCTRTSTGGTNYLFYTYGSAATETYNLANNELYNNGGTLGTFTGTIYGSYSYTAGTGNLYNNHFHNIYAGGSGSIYGYYSTGLAAATANIYNNMVDSLVSGAAAVAGSAVYGMYMLTANSNVYNNQIFYLRSNTTSSTVYGCYVSSGPVVTLYNNFISDLRTPASTSTNAINGIYILGGTTINAYYNTIYLNATSSSATTFGTTGIYASTTPTVNLRNNVVINVSTPGPTATAYTVAYRRSSITQTTYATTSNCNCFYAGTPGAQRLIFHNGTAGDQTLALYKTRVQPCDGASVTELPPFVNVAVAPYDIHIQTNKYTRLESGALPVAGVTTDIDGNLRNTGSLLLAPPYPNTAPDMGADEFLGDSVIDVAPPNIGYTPIASNPYTTNIIFKVRITDPVSHVDTSITTNAAPRLYYKKGNLGTWQIDTAKSYAAGDTYTFTFDYVRVGGVVTFDTIFYYVAAQDSSGNAGTNPAGGSGLNPPGSTAPTYPNSYRILFGFSGDYLIGVGQPRPFMCLDSFFLAINQNALLGNTRGLIVTDINELASCDLNPLNCFGGTWKLRIEPQGAARTVWGSIAAPLIDLNSVDNVTINGNLGGVKSLTFRNKNTANSVIRFINDATNDSVVNCNLEGAAASTSVGVVLLSTTVAPLGGVTGNSNNVIAYNDIRDRSDSTAILYSGIVNYNTVVPYNGPNTIIGNNIYNFTYYGTYLYYLGNNWIIRGNSLFEQPTATRTVVTTRYPLYVYSNQSSGHLIYGNYIGGSAPLCGGSPWVDTAASAMYGIYWYNSGAPITSPTYIRKNTIQNITFASTTGSTFYGIYAYYPYNVVYVDSNVVGSDATPNSILHNGSAPTMRGIYVGYTQATSACYVTDNLVANIEHTGTGTGTLQGISVYANASPSATISRNRVHHLASATSYLGYALVGGPCTGIVYYPSPSWTYVTINDNLIYEISGRNTAALGNLVSGMNFTNVYLLVANNKIYGIHNASTSTTVARPVAAGIFVRATSNAAFVNNMISLGSDPQDTTNTEFIGIHNQWGTSNSMLMYYNSVLISGMATWGANPSFGFLRGDTGIAQITTTITARNNIFVNRRTGASGKHYAMGNPGPAVSTQGWDALASDYNVLYTANPTTLGLWGPNDLDFAGWQVASPIGTGGDLNSINRDPIFLTNTDLHVNAGCNVPNRGATPIGPITVDIDGQTRGANFPDIGCDEYTPNAPGAVTLISPATNAINQPLAGQLVWNTTANASHYDVYLDAINPPANKRSTLQADTLYNYSSLAQGTKHYWRIVAWNDTIPMDVGTSQSGVDSFTTYSPPSAPTNLLLSNIRKDSMDLAWTDWSLDEVGFYIRRDIDPLGSFPIIDSVGASVTSYNAYGLTANTHYYFRVSSFKYLGPLTLESNFAAKDSWTTAETPGAVTSTRIEYLKMLVNLTPGVNPATTEYVVRVNFGTDSKNDKGTIKNNSDGAASGNGSELNFQPQKEGSGTDDITRYLNPATGTLVTSEVWGTYAQFGSAGGIVVKNLRPGVAYTFDVKARNSINIETGYGPTAILTTLAPLAVPQTESFQIAGFPPFGWDSVTVFWPGSGTRPLFSKVSAGTTPTCTPYDGDSMAKFNSYNTAALNQARMWTPPIIIPTTASVMDFYMYHSTAGNDTLAIEISTDYGTAWTELARYSVITGTAGWQQHFVTLTGYANDTVLVAFRGISRLSQNIFFDLVKVENYRDVAVTAINRPNLIEGKRVPFSPEDTVINNGSVTENIPVVNEIWTTGQGMFEGFEGTTFPPTGWVRYNNDGGTQQWIRSTTYYRTGVASATSAYESSTLRNDDWLVTPQYAVLSGDQLRFWYRTSTVANDSMEVRLSTTGNAIPNFTVLLDAFGIRTSTYTERVISLNAYAGQNVYIAFVNKGLYQWTISIDDITLGTYLPPTMVYVDTQTVTNVAAGAKSIVTFDPVTLNNEGSYLNRCYTIMTGDLFTGNNLLTKNFVVNPLTLNLALPVNGTLTNDPTPTFSWNPVTGATSYRIQIATANDFSAPSMVVNTTVTAANHTPILPDTTYYWHVRVETPTPADPYSATWTLTVDATTPNVPVLIAPADGDTGVTLTPTFEWSPVSFFGKKQSDAVLAGTDASPVRYRIQVATDNGFGNIVLDDSLTVATLLCPLTLDSSTTYYWHVRAADAAGNVSAYSSTFDFKTVSSYAPPQPAGWVPMTDVPAEPSTKKPKSGTCMAALNGEIYILKASNTQDFAKFTPGPSTGAMTLLDTIPIGLKADGDGKKPKKGASMAAYADSKLFVLRGNNTAGFWKYVVTAGPGETLGWKKLTNIPTGAKNPKDASGMVAITKGGNDYIFTMKGSKTDEFYLYDIAANTWAPTPTKPTAGTSTKVGYKKGSCLAYDRSNYVYILKGSYGDMFRYSVASDSFVQLKQFNYKTFINRLGKKKKVGEGSGMVYYNNDLYILKGGNTTEFWRYQIVGDTYVQADSTFDIPLGPTGKKKVKAGGGLAMIASNGFYAAKGANTQEFYYHGLPTFAITLKPTNDSKAEGAMGNNIATGNFRLTIAPNPAINLTAVHYTLPKAGPVSFKLYDVTGATVRTYANTNPTKDGVLMIDLSACNAQADAKALPSGVYVLRFNAGEINVTRKLVLQK
jgi:hypothetical protein